MIFIEKPPLIISSLSDEIETIYLCYITNIYKFLGFMKKTSRLGQPHELPGIIKHAINDPEAERSLSKTTIDFIKQIAKQIDEIHLSHRIKSIGELKNYKKNIKMVVVFTQTYKNNSTWKQYLPLTKQNAIYMNKRRICDFINQMVLIVLPKVSFDIHLLTTKRSHLKTNNIFKIQRKIEDSPHFIPKMEEGK